jgi:hypothetical protein
MISNVSQELEDFYKDHDEDKNQKNFRLLIDEFEDMDFLFPGLETFDINPVLSTEEEVCIVDIKSKVKPSNNKTLF